MGAWVNPAAREATLRRSGLLRRHIHVHVHAHVHVHVHVHVLTLQ